MATNVTPPRGELDRFDSVEKKESITHNEYAASDPSGLEGQDVKVDIDHGIDPTVLKRIIRKVDWRLVPTLAAMYCVSLIDRTNLSYARQANNMWMDTELGTKYGNRYSVITAVFFIPYIVLEIPVSDFVRCLKWFKGKRGGKEEVADGREERVWLWRNAC